ncbi:MAG: virulence RhuM family protein [Dehalobacter sp. 4CP]|nr:virulence RhuM family protein [Dehalobacter sp. 4CP]
MSLKVSVGYRVKSLRGTQFRRWALEVLKVQNYVKLIVLGRPCGRQSLKMMPWNQPCSPDSLAGIFYSWGGS